MTQAGGPPPNDGPNPYRDSGDAPNPGASAEGSSQSNTPPVSPGLTLVPDAIPSTSDERTMAMLAHLLPLVAGVIGPLIIWLVKKDESPFVNEHGKESLNFQLTVLIAYFVSGLLICVYIGIILLPAVRIAALVFEIQATIAANKGQMYRYPVSIRMVS